MLFRRLAPALALFFLMISCAAEMTPEQKARAEQQRRAAKAKKERAKFELKKKQQVWKDRLKNISKEIKAIRESGQAAEKSGKLRQAFQLYMESFRKYTDWYSAYALPYPPKNSTSPYPVAKRHGNEKIIRHLILRVSAKLDPPPAIPPAIERHSVRAGVYIRRAQSKAELGKAIAEYWSALSIAPWWVDGYFNIALVMEKAERVDLAIQYLKLYLAGKPNAPDIRSVRRKLIALEVVSEEMAPFKPWLGVWRGGNFHS